MFQCPKVVIVIEWSLFKMKNDSYILYYAKSFEWPNWMIVNLLVGTVHIGKVVVVAKEVV